MYHKENSNNEMDDITSEREHSEHANHVENTTTEEQIALEADV